MENRNGRQSRGLRTSPVSWLGGTSAPGSIGASKQPSRGVALEFALTTRRSTKRLAAVACVLIHPPYSRAAATAYLRKSRLSRNSRTVFPCTKSTVIVGGVAARYGLRGTAT